MTFGDLISRSENIESELSAPKKVTRFEDKTQEEVQEDIKRRRRVQYSKMVKFRTYQLGSMTVIAFLYIFVYRKMFAPKSVMNSAIYHQTINYLKGNDKIHNSLGKHIQVMNCNGKIYPIKNNVEFDLVIFGSN